MRENIFRTVLVAASLLFISGHFAQAADPKERDVILSTTTSTQDSGLLDVLIPLFEKQTGYRVKTVAVRTDRNHQGVTHWTAGQEATIVRKK